MIFFDTTKTAAAGHRSGLTRVSRRLAEELGAAAQAVRWPEWPRPGGAGDWLLTAELFSEPERPGLTEFLATRRLGVAAVFHDAIPLKHPQITWSQSVARHPGYLKLLARFDRVWAVSRASQVELEAFWRWQRVERVPPVEVLPLGADFSRQPRTTARAVPGGRPLLLCVGIIEPRKNQAFLADVAERLWREGVDFELHFVGRVNPEFGPAVERRLRDLARRERRLVIHAAVDDAALAALYQRARATVFPTRAEGCGLPLLESLWSGVPCVCSDLPVLRENADAGGCVVAPLNDAVAWSDRLRELLTDAAVTERLTREAGTRPLPTWSAAAARLRAALT